MAPQTLPGLFLLDQLGQHHPAFRTNVLKHTSDHATPSHSLPHTQSPQGHPAALGGARPPLPTGTFHTGSPASEPSHMLFPLPARPCALSLPLHTYVCFPPQGLGTSPPTSPGWVRDLYPQLPRASLTKAPNIESPPMSELRSQQTEHHVIKWIRERERERPRLQSSFNVLDLGFVTVTGGC